MIRLIALDLDNTLLMEDNSIPGEVCEALRRISCSGVEVMIASGRLLPFALDYAEEIDCRGPIMAYNGGWLETREGEVLFQALIPESIRQEMAVFCRENHLYLQQYDPWGGHQICIEKLREDFPLARYRLPDSYYRECGKLEDAAIQTPKLVIYDRPERLKSLLPIIRERFDPALDYSFSDHSILEMMPRGVSKGSTLQLYCESRGIRPEEVMAFGDSGNDASMLCYAGIGVAVANASGEIRELADYQARGARSFGVLEGLERFILF